MSVMGAKDQRQGSDEVLASGEYPLTRRDLTEIAAMIYSDAGIFLNETKASLVYSRLSKHIRNLGLSGFREYCDLVASPAGAAPRREMLSHLTTNFTRFFRETIISTICATMSCRSFCSGRDRAAGCASGRPRPPTGRNPIRSR